MSELSRALRRARRRADRRLYRLFQGLGGALARPTTARPDPMMLRRILIVRHDRIGDWVVTTPVVALLREIAPDAEIDVLASPVNAPLVRNDDRIARVIVNDHSWPGWLRAIGELRARRYDVVISPIYYRHLREEMVAALAAGGRAYALSVWRPRRYQGAFSAVIRAPRSWRHMAEKLLYVVQEGLLGRTQPRGESARRWPMRVFTDSRAEHRAAALLDEQGVREFVAVNLHAAEPHREWPVASCVETLRALLERHRDLSFVVTPPPGRDADAAEVVRRCANGRVLAAPSSKRLVDLVALLRRARLVITPDTANVHLAAASGVPVLVLTSAISTAPELWTPFGVPYRAVAAGRQPVSAIPSDAVVDAFESLWSGVDAERPDESPAC